MSAIGHSVHRATLEESKLAFALVCEYYQEAAVLARENCREFEDQYFAEGAGVWLAIVEGEPVGCVALRKLAWPENCGELKRMYVRAERRANGIANTLLEALEKYAAQNGYESLYLDTADSMLAAVRFYERNGYKRCERYNQNPQATVFMRKKIKLDSSVPG